MRKTICVLFFGLLALQPFPAAAADFDHAPHAEEELDCATCHLEAIGVKAQMPPAAVCLDCHENEEIDGAMGAEPTSHAGDYRFEHQFDARSFGDCALCHDESESCTLCHHGENVDYQSHDRNHGYTHAVDAYRGTEDCEACHDTRSYCTDCHVANGIRPGNHMVSDWGGLSSPLHADAARDDVGSCLLCHEDDEATCGGCH